VRHLVALTLLVVTMIGCRGEGTVSPHVRQADGLRPSADMGMDCFMYSFQCEAVRSGIDYLLQHANQTCKDVGARALDRYNAMPGVAGFTWGNGKSGYDSYVIMKYPAATPSGYGPTDNYTYMEPSFWNYDRATQGTLIAHEEQHQNGLDGIYHNTGSAYFIQNTCLNPQA
jgi:hypothetical protein